MAAACIAASASAQDKRQSFEEFRRGILNDYSDFRKTILDHYADFLNGEWHEYESLNGEKRDRNPKPRTVPTVKTPKPAAKPADKPDNTPGADKSDTPPQQPAQNAKRVTEPTPGKPSHPSGPAVRPHANVDQFLFYQLPMQIPKIDFNISRRLAAPADYASHWMTLDHDKVARNVLPHIRQIASEAGFNDYLTFRLIEAYINAKFPDSDISSRMATVHYLLANMGYDARIAVTTSGTPLLLLPFKQTIYARNYMMTGDGDGKYYVFAPDDFDMSRMATERIMTCRIPSDLPRGNKFDLVLGRLNIPVQPKAFNFEYGPIHISGEVNENLMPILYKYPQMPVGDFAKSNPDPEMRRKIAAQIKSQLADKEGDEAVESLLAFMHNVFEYSTDEDFHGFEKPYFVEETLYYPKNDCEDRAIFYTYFLWNALGREAQLISFPGHEAATVMMDNPVEGTAYPFGTATFYISDPTYIGSKTGMVMPIYRTTPPTVDYTYQ